MKKTVSLLFAGLILITALVSCGRRAMPLDELESANALAMALYTRAGLSMDAVFTEPLDNTIAFRFGMNIADFDETVESAVAFRRTTGVNGQMLYALRMKTEDAAELWAENLYNNYEWTACDNAEKLTVACAGQYLILFKSDAAEVDAVSESFRALAGGRVLYSRELVNRGA